MFSPSSLAWSLLGSISVPIFEGGRLQANEEIARLNAQKQEQQYLQTLYDAFADVENAISQQQSLKAQYTSTLEAQKNALAAEQLSFEQYQSVQLRQNAPCCLPSDITIKLFKKL